MAISVKLIVRLAGKNTAEFVLTGQDAIVGRDAKCDVVISNPRVSSQHGVFRFDEGGYSFTDLSSRNGSALRREGSEDLAILKGGEAILVEEGATLLLGGAKEPAEIHVESVTAPFADAMTKEKTIVAFEPLLDLTEDTGTHALVTLAARAITAKDADALAEVSLSAIRTLFPEATDYGVILNGSGFAVNAGSALPRGLSSLALESDQVVLLEEDRSSLPATASIASSGMRAAVLAPLSTGKGHFGILAAWSALGVEGLRESNLKTLSVAASLIGLTAANLAVRAEGEARLEQMKRQIKDGNKSLGTPFIEPAGTSPAFLETVNLAKTIAPANIPILLQGETGTGKEILARAIHHWSGSAKKPFVAFNCAAVPEHLVESELFGHVKGAFTGAGSDRKGLFEEASGGTIFLDEIGEMDPSLQAKLLRVLQDGEIRRVGSNTPRQVLVRVLSATHQNLDERVEEGSFRQDLLYRLNAVTLRIPPLRERQDDVLMIAHQLLGRICLRSEKRLAGFSREALSCLMGHDFPGNIRELENEIRRAVALTSEGETISPEKFSDRLQKAEGIKLPKDALLQNVSLRSAVERAERTAVQSALVESGGNVSKAARQLELTRPGLYKVMERLGVKRD
jgi:transcriptional regulator with GAF, ATPase, and Fis domain